MRGSAKEFRQIERQAGTFAETLTDTLSPSHRCSYRRGIPSPSLPDLIRQPALQQLGVGCRVEPGNDGESATVMGRDRSMVRAVITTRGRYDLGWMNSIGSMTR